jgi:hypothetical protein
MIMDSLTLLLIVTTSLLLGAWVMTGIVILWDYRARQRLLVSIQEAKMSLSAAQGLLDRERQNMNGLSDRVNALSMHLGKK